ncbi:hypothetical protein CEF21_01405 [Bacillus sp. FJAT-42376]|uniref:hypothetical protein n=1 Tax=Bacillus sp. FJAT-42376 TaxID=2014076 RepID=UPI000F4D9E82|nr:hypothetical protein [Bacillus sp. FJAT-42376]AZB41105.1 hypothetical protein CEF21_01405 [Bacillus sp. FJAT-42376]
MKTSIPVIILFLVCLWLLFALPFNQWLIFTLLLVPLFFLTLAISKGAKNYWISIPFNTGLGFLFVFWTNKLIGLFSNGAAYVQLFLTSLILLISRIMADNGEDEDEKRKK